MTASRGLRRSHFKDIQPKDPDILRLSDWSTANRAFYQHFREWLAQSSYSASSINMYSPAARAAIGYLKKEYWQIDPEQDLARVLEHLETRSLSPHTCMEYRKGLAKFAEFIRLKLHLAPKARDLNWDRHIGMLSDTLQQDIREFIHFRSHSWKEEHIRARSAELLYALSRPLRWMQEHFAITEVCQLTPNLWYAWLDHRLAAGVKSTTMNTELSYMKHFLHFLQEREHEVCERFFLIKRLEKAQPLPKDVPAPELRVLQQTIEGFARTTHIGKRRMGLMDLAWFLLMLHSGLRSCEIRDLKLSDIEWDSKRLRVDQSKGLKDRLVPMSDAAMQAIRNYLEVRGPSEALPEQLFIFRHARLSDTYLGDRLRSYARLYGIPHVTPHRLRHSCATLLLNSGAPVLSVQQIMGHKQIDTTLGYARLYDGTVAADYYSAMNRVERQLNVPEEAARKVSGFGELIALTDALHRGTLNSDQGEIVRLLREGLSSLAEQQMPPVQRHFIKRPNRAPLPDVEIPATLWSAAAANAFYFGIHEEEPAVV